MSTVSGIKTSEYFKDETIEKMNLSNYGRDSNQVPMDYKQGLQIKN